MRLAIIGCGSIGLRHLKNALALGCEVYVFDTEPDRRQAGYALGARNYSFELDESLPGLPRVDAMMVCTPHNRHLHWAQWAVDSKIALFVEKPLGSLDQIEDWRRLVKASESLVTMTGYNWRFNQRLRWYREIHNGERITGLDFVCDTSMADWLGRSYGDPVLECSHEIDLALSWDAPQFVPSVRFAKREASSAFIEFTGGVTVRLDWDARPYREVTIEVDGEEKEPCRYGADHLLQQSYRDELDHFLCCVQSGRQTDVPLADGLRVLEVCAQVEQMVRQHA
jgi:predicted dehydrogenase